MATIDIGGPWCWGIKWGMVAMANTFANIPAGAEWTEYMAAPPDKFEVTLADIRKAGAVTALVRQVSLPADGES